MSGNKRQEIGKLERRHEFDRNLINLIELFLEKEFPEYTWKFDIFLDKYYE
jgi:hypothetical protein